MLAASSGTAAIRFRPRRPARGQAKVLTLAATTVLIGRAYPWGLAAGGQAGVENALDFRGLGRSAGGRTLQTAVVPAFADWVPRFVAVAQRLLALFRTSSSPVLWADMHFGGVFHTGDRTTCERMFYSRALDIRGGGRADLAGAGT
ncbi:alpha-hydroxy-acid oxidizing protein [Amycolatopsis japonica]